MPLSGLLRFGQSGQFLLDLDQTVIFKFGLPPRIPIPLTPSAVRVLQVLAIASIDPEARPWITRDQISEQALVAYSAVGNYIEALRKAFGRECIPNLSNSGYRLSPPASSYNDVGIEPKTIAIAAGSTGYAGPSRRGVQSHEEMDRELLEKTYLAYRDVRVPLMHSTELVVQLEKRYRCEAVRLAGRAFPVSILWTNENRLVDPNVILGHFDPAEPRTLRQTATLGPQEYAKARLFIKAKYETGPIRYEGIDYRMISIDVDCDVPKVNGAFGYYYDAILTQFAMEWELKKALLTNTVSDVLGKPGSLPLREAVEQNGNPAINGLGRCAALSICTLVIFKRRHDDSFYCLLRRRSLNVGVSPGTLHVVPSGMFEAKNFEPWSVEMNVWREFLEEVYNDEELLGTGEPELQDHILGKTPITVLKTMIAEGSAEFSLTGICYDLLSIRPEICTVVFIRDPIFFESRKMEFNWEYETGNWTDVVAGTGVVRWNDIDRVVKDAANTSGVAVAGAACIALGRRWASQRHGI